MTTAAASILKAPSPARSPWFKSARFDLLLILAVPFLTWPLIMGAEDVWGPELLNTLIVLTATGHYFSTFVRTYGDLELFQRFRTRFLLTPVVLLITCVGLFTTGNFGPIMLLTACWAFWHWLAQAFGFARIYDIKVGSYNPLTASLDKALVITGFVGAVVLNSGSTATFGKVFLNAGVPLPSAEQFVVVQQIVLGLMILVGAAYVANLGWTLARRQPWSWQKHFMNVTTIGYYWFAFAYLPNVLIAYVLYELFHDIQYFAITWLTCRHRVQRPAVASWLGHMFRPGWVAAVCFILTMVAFGAIDVGGRSLSSDSFANQVSLGVFLAMALLHFYYDGFIWKARESSLGTDLGIQGGLKQAMVPGLRHASYWALFFVPLLLLHAFGHGEFTPRERGTALVAVAPGDFVSQAELAFELAKDRDLPQALEHYRVSIAANPNYGVARANYGSALEYTSDLDGARSQYRAALFLHDHGGRVHSLAHINLGVLLLMGGERIAADEHFQAGQKLRGANPIDRMMAMVAELPPEAVDHRRQLYAAVLQLKSNLFDVRMSLANNLLEQGQPKQAAEQFRVVLQTYPNHVPGLVGLANTQVKLGQILALRPTLQKLLKLEPKNARGLELQAKFGR